MFMQQHVYAAGYEQAGPFTAGPITLGPKALEQGSWWDMFLGEQWQMWHYHTTLTAGHPYYSLWWQWFLDIRPVFYYVDRPADGLVANIYNIGNPLLYWSFSIALIAAFFFVWSRRQPRFALVLAAFLINWLAWAHTPRGMFFYHFLPSVPFMVILVTYGIVSLWRQRRWPRLRYLAPAYVGLIVLGFLFFYSQLTGVVVPTWWAAVHYWLPSWE
jgi:dolichyl-phosphate-mannose--protein O-mannosyl transferase